MPVRLQAAIFLFVVGIAADMGSTYLAVSTGRFVEASPVGAVLVDRHGLIAGMIFTKVVGLVLIGIPVAIAGGTRRVVLTVMLGGVGVLSLGAAARNMLLVTDLWL